MHIEVLHWLRNHAEEKYRVFSAKLLPQKTELLGVRVPILRQYTKTLIKEGKGEAYLAIPPQKLKYQEELMLYALILANIKLPEDTKIVKIKNFVPYINSWAVCDILCADLKGLKKAPQTYCEIFKPYIYSHKEYQIRFFYVLALNYFISENLLPQLFECIARQKYVGYYDKMAVAWMLSVAYIKFPQKVEEFLFNTPLDSFVYKKSISKICDSYRVNKEAKLHLRTLASACKI